MPNVEEPQINISHITNITGVGGLGMLAMVGVIAYAIPAIRTLLLVAVAGGFVGAVAVILLHRTRKPSRTSTGPLISLRQEMSRPETTTPVPDSTRFAHGVAM